MEEEEDEMPKASQGKDDAKSQGDKLRNKDEANQDNKSENNEPEEAEGDLEAEETPKSNPKSEKGIKTPSKKSNADEEDEIISVRKDKNPDSSDEDSIDLGIEDQLLIEIESLYSEATETKEKVEHLKYMKDKLKLLSTVTLDEDEEINEAKLLKQIHNEIGKLKDPDFEPEPEEQEKSEHSEDKSDSDKRRSEEYCRVRKLVTSARKFS